MKIKSEAQKERMRVYKREKYAQKKLKGICCRCSQPAIPSRTLCERHAADVNRLNLWQKKRRKAESRCRDCGNRLTIFDPPATCAECLELRERNKKNTI